MLTCIIVDDEPKARKILQQLLEEYCENIEVLALAEDVPTAIKAINQHKPQIVFLDIEMPNYSGFQLFDFIEKPNFEVIFTTAYQEYAIKAFQVSAIDYLLKPIQIDLLITAVEKVKEKEKYLISERVDVLKSNLDEQCSRLALPISDGFIFVDVDEIILLKAERSYTKIFAIDKEPMLVCKNIKSYEELLPIEVFFRINRSFLVNINRIKQYTRQDGGYVIMHDGQTCSLSKDKKEAFLKLYSIVK